MKKQNLDLDDKYGNEACSRASLNQNSFTVSESPIETRDGEALSNNYKDEAPRAMVSVSTINERRGKARERCHIPPA